MRKKAIYILIVLLLAGIGYFSWKQFKKGGHGGKQFIQTVTANLGPIENLIEATGEVAPLNRVEIKPPVGGRIEKILIDEGSNVKAGQILAWMSSSDRAAVIDAARAQGPSELKRWEDAYKPTPIVAPLSGVVILRNIVVGQTVDVSTVLFALSDQLIVVAHVDEVDIGRIHPQMPAHIVLDAYPTDVIDGQVFTILYEGKNVSNVITYSVKVTPKTTPPFFRSQMTANVKFIIEQKNNALLVPSAAVQTTAGGEKQVMVPGPDGKPSPVPVKIGSDNGDNTEIVSGLNEGDKVLIVRQRYVPQKGTASSPLVVGGRPGGSSGGSGGGGNRGGGGGR